MTGAGADDNIRLSYRPKPGAPTPSATVDGGAGNDTIFVAGVSATVAGGEGDDTIFPDVEFGQFTTPRAPGTVVTGGPGDDRLIGGTGDDRIQALGGNDIVDVRDGKGGDFVDCGDGADVVYLDRGDTQVNCETVHYASGGDERGQDGRPSAAVAPRLTRKRLVVRGRSTVLRLRCTGRRSCAGTVRITRRGSSRSVLARGRYRIRAGSTKAVPVRLTRLGRRAGSRTRAITWLSPKGGKRTRTSIVLVRRR